MATIGGDEHTILGRVQAIFDEVTPGARCELQDYSHKIGCGNMDQWGNIQDVVFVRAGIDDDQVRHHAAVLAIKLRTAGRRSGPSSDGGSTYAAPKVGGGPRKPTDGHELTHTLRKLRSSISSFFNDLEAFQCVRQRIPNCIPLGFLLGIKDLAV